ncbi:uncharacterized protein EAF01_000516 [Botrytis porri]|uniref:uncharacterized protein n=1 Tax=Botrytis porri TaxID=87229 RepID=UPI00190148BE|nr:uncharacterized protein EAF01_000516 [Botrytis porri]KAF7914110.1 hypothetical protein EAF01_000516 [Botrytis porri]
MISRRNEPTKITRERNGYSVDATRLPKPGAFAGSAHAFEESPYYTLCTIRTLYLTFSEPWNTSRTE